MNKLKSCEKLSYCGEWRIRNKYGWEVARNVNSLYVDLLSSSLEMYNLLEFLKDRFSEVSLFDLQKYFGRTDFEQKIELVLKKARGEG